MKAKREVVKRLISLTDENKEQGWDGYAAHFLSEKADEGNRIPLETRYHQ